MQLRQSDLQELHCIVPMANLPSIVRRGILSHDRADAVPHHSVASEEVQALRARKVVPNGRRLHEYANLYIDARNPMMYVRKGAHLDLCVLRVSTDVLDLPNVVIADGNAATGITRFAPSPEGLARIDRDLVFAEWWNGNGEARRVRCAEVLVPDSVHPRFLLGAYVSCEPALRRFNELHLTEPRLQATVLEHMFYR
ncbi:MAG: DUF4433 domain-containing protein [Chloroflexota bacterium]|nr:DUF4433 domain-containing protein [Chloroflexota bacterium]